MSDRPPLVPLVGGAGVLAALVAAGTLLLPALRRPALPPLACRVALAPFVETVVLPGHLDAEEFVDLRAPAAACERQLVHLLPEGTPVKKGEVVAQFDPGPLLLWLERMENELRDIEMGRETTEGEWEGIAFEGEVLHDSSLENLELVDIQRQKMAYEAELARRRSDMEYNISERWVHAYATHVTRIERIKDAKVAERDRAADNLRDRIANTRLELDAFRVVAPTASLVVYPPIPVAAQWRKVQPGDALDRAQPFARLPKLETFIARVPVDETVANRLAAGMKAVVRPHADRSLALVGRVARIARAVAYNQSPEDPRQRFEVVVALAASGTAVAVAPPTDRLRLGMVVEVTFALKEYGPRFAVPKEFVAAAGRKPTILAGAGGQQPTRIAIPEAAVVDDYYLLERCPLGGGAAIAGAPAAAPIAEFWVYHEAAADPATAKLAAGGEPGPGTAHEPDTAKQ